MPGTTQTQDFRKMRVDQVGSLAAPQKLRAAFKRFKNAEINREELAPFQDDAIREVIKGQEAIGFPIITDGEFRRSNFQESFGAAVTGFHVAKEDKAMEGVNTNPFQRAEQNFEAPGAPIITRRRAVERLKLAKNIPLEEYLFSKKVATKPVRQTVLSADRISQRFDLQNSRDVYRNMDEFLADISENVIGLLVESPQLCIRSRGTAPILSSGAAPPSGVTHPNMGGGSATWRTRAGVRTSRLASEIASSGHRLLSRRTVYSLNLRP